MPLYDYRCDNCGDFEKWLKLAELDSPVHCSSCDQVAFKLISAPNISLNNGRFPMAQTPQVVTRKQSAPPSRLQQAKAGRPWMVSHPPARY